jgi:hypothetical protein
MVLDHEFIIVSCLSSLCSYILVDNKQKIVEWGLELPDQPLARSSDGQG